MRALNSALRCRRFRLLILVLFRGGRPQKPAQFVNKPLAPFPGATSKEDEMPFDFVDLGMGPGLVDGGAAQNVIVTTAVLTTSGTSPFSGDGQHLKETTLTTNPSLTSQIV